MEFDTLVINNAENLLTMYCKWMFDYILLAMNEWDVYFRYSTCVEKFFNVHLEIYLSIQKNVKYSVQFLQDSA